MSTLTIHILNSFITVETILLLLTNSVMRKKQKLMELHNFDKVKSLMSQVEKLRALRYNVSRFQADRASAKLIVTAGSEELIIPHDSMPLTPQEIVQLTVNRIDNKIASLESEIEKL